VQSFEEDIVEAIKTKLESTQQLEQELEEIKIENVELKKEVSYLRAIHERNTQNNKEKNSNSVRKKR